MISEKEVLDYLWDNPGKTSDQLFKALGVTEVEDRRAFLYDMQDKLLNEGRLSIVRFTSYAPNLRTTFMLFATEHGRIEIIDNDEKDFIGFQIGHIHDPYGKWDELNDKYTD